MIEELTSSGGMSGMDFALYVDRPAVGLAESRKLVINVDDLALHSAVSRFVGRAIERSAITSASVLANGPCLNDVRAMNNAREFTNVGLGAHLNMLRGPPLSPPDEVGSLLGANGMFLGSFSSFFLRLSAGYIKTSEIERECSRQIEHLLDIGLRLTHLDSEQHTHCLPVLLPIIGRLACRYGVRWVRRPVELVRPGAPLVNRMKAKLLDRWVSKAGPLPPGISGAQLVWGIIDQGPRFSAKRLASYLQLHHQAAVIEVICHPGLPTPSDAIIPSSYGRLRVPRHWEFEAQTILSEHWRHAISECGFSPVHFGSI
jgi:chitin disaccharide deacetylase